MAPLTARGARPRLPAGRALGLFLLCLFLFARFGDAFGIPFLNDDYVFLDHVARRSFTSLWGFTELAFHWWRPWSREFHYWWLQRAFGPSEGAFHAASFVLSGAVLAAYWALARRLAGTAAAAVAVAGAATLPGWGLLLLWPAGAQDLWMLLLSLLALLAWRADRVGLAALAYALALASKETAAPLPLLFLAIDRWGARRPLTESLVRVLPAAAVALAWALAHPLLLGRLWMHAPVALAPSAAAVPVWKALLSSLLSTVSLDRLPAPDGGWRSVGWDALRGALLLIVFVGSFARPDARPHDRLGLTRPARFHGALPVSLVWWACGTLPLLVPGLGWHAYYAQFATLGTWLAIGCLLARQGPLALGLVAALAAIGAGRAATPSLDWGEAAYQRRAGAFVADIREKLLGAYPKMEPHARLWFMNLPNNIGFLAGDGPAVRVWYRDPTLQANYFPAYRPRAANDPAGPDHFFRIDETGQFLELVRSTSADTVVAAGTTLSPRWRMDRLSLASALAMGKDWHGAALEFRRLAIAYPESSGFAFDAATSFMQAGDSAHAFGWFAEAARRPGATPELLRAVSDILPEKPAGAAGPGPAHVHRRGGRRGHESSRPPRR